MGWRVEMFNGENKSLLFLETLYTADLVRLSLLLPLATCITMFINCPQSNSTAEQPGRILSLCTACTLYLMLLFLSTIPQKWEKRTLPYKNSLNVKNKLSHQVKKMGRI
jgi:hypothetical protein